MANLNGNVIPDATTSPIASAIDMDGAGMLCVLEDGRSFSEVWDGSAWVRGETVKDPISGCYCLIKTSVLVRFLVELMN